MNHLAKQLSKAQQIPLNGNIVALTKVESVKPKRLAPIEPSIVGANRTAEHNWMRDLWTLNAENSLANCQRFHMERVVII
jgi:hypothetical protein